MIVNFINDDEVALELDEIDCQELAYLYLNWKNGGKGYGRCEYCGRLIKQSKTNPNRFCEACAVKIGNIADDIKVILCVDCGEIYYTSIKDNVSCRCEKCREIRNKAAKSDRNRKYYLNHKE